MGLEDRRSTPTGWLGTWRIDHWAEAVAQGAHAPRLLLHDLGFGADPGPYLPRSPYTPLIHGRTVAGVGMTGGYGCTRVVSPEPLVVVHKRDASAIGAAGIDSTGSVFEWIRRLYARRPSARIENERGNACAHGRQRIRSA